MARPTHRITPNQKGGWDLKKDGAKKATKHFDTQAQAIKEGRPISKNQETEFVIHDKKGKIRAADSHGNDPYPPKG